MHNGLQRLLTSIVLIGGFLGTYFFCPAWVLSAVFAALCATLLLFEWPQLRLPWYAMAYPIFSFFLLILLNQNTAERPLIFVIFTLAASFDLGAYCSGKLFGKHYLAPHISPKKTWEGFAGGILFSFVATKLLFHALGIQLAPVPFLLFIIAGDCAAFIGDLFESYLKRRVFIKNSGTLLPGHGGIFDRFDSIFTVTFFVFICRSFILSCIIS